jgi:hypothetical protein
MYIKIMNFTFILGFILLPYCFCKGNINLSKTQLSCHTAKNENGTLYYINVEGHPLINSIAGIISRYVYNLDTNILCISNIKLESEFILDKNKKVSHFNHTDVADATGPGRQVCGDIIIINGLLKMFDNKSSNCIQRNALYWEEFMRNHSHIFLNVGIKMVEEKNLLSRTGIKIYKYDRFIIEHSYEEINKL